jgi:hypothetical protein
MPFSFAYFDDLRLFDYATLIDSAIAAMIIDYATRFRRHYFFRLMICRHCCARQPRISLMPLLIITPFDIFIAISLLMPPLFRHAIRHYCLRHY